ncbi:hypothetical protein Pelo_19726 [Pelomyxa schiedti]|nr:hypothetical protein Pelo_19726 [Pelomyxa schiedti]
MQRVGVDATGEMLHSVEVLEWAMERFPRCFIFENPKFLKYLIPLACEKAGHDDREAVRLCKWLKENVEVGSVCLQYRADHRDFAQFLLKVQS